MGQDEILLNLGYSRRLVDKPLVVVVQTSKVAQAHTGTERTLTLIPFQIRSSNHPKKHDKYLLGFFIPKAIFNIDSGATEPQLSSDASTCVCHCPICPLALLCTFTQPTNTLEGCIPPDNGTSILCRIDCCEADSLLPPYSSPDKWSLLQGYE